MKPSWTALIVALALPALPAAAQDRPPDAPADLSEGAELMQRGFQSMLRGLFSEMGPVLDEMGRALDGMRPMAEQMLQLIDDIGNYEAPVILPNGDILIRRKPRPPAPLKEGEVDL